MDLSFQAEDLSEFLEAANSSSDEEDIQDQSDRLGLRREKRSTSKEAKKQDFQNEKFVFSSRNSNLQKFEKLKIKKELSQFINKFWELSLEERLEMIDNLDSILTLIGHKDLDALILSLFGNKYDYVSKSIIQDFLMEDRVNQNFGSEKVKIDKNIKTKCKYHY